MEKINGGISLEKLKEKGITEQLIEDFKKKIILRLKAKNKSEQEIEDLFSFLESIPSTDLFNFLRFFTMKNIVKNISPGNVLQNYNSNQFVKSSSSIDIKKTRKIEDSFIDCFLEGNFNFLEISPLKPLGTSYIIGKNSPNKVITTGFNSELINDPSYSLTLEGANNIKRNIEESSLFTISTSIRNQQFSNPLYLPYFKTGSGSKICKRGTSLENFDKILAEIINNNLKFLNILKGKGFKIGKINLQLSHGFILYKILKEKLKLNNEDAEKIVYNYRKEYGNGFSSEILTDLGIDDKFNFNKNNIKESEYNKFFKNVITNLDLSLIDDLEIDFSRLTGIGHYNGIIFTIFIEGNNGLKTDIIDGGSVNWVNDLLSTKGYKQIVFGTGIELLGKNF